MKRTLLLIILMLGMTIVAPVFAQDTYEFPDSGVSIIIPAGWELSEDSDGHIELSDSPLTMVVYDSAALEANFGVEDAETGSDVLDIVVPELPSAVKLGLTTSNVTSMQVDGRDVAMLPYFTDSQRGRILAVPMSDGTFGLIDVVSDRSAFNASLSDISDVIASFDSTGEGEGGLGNLDIDLSNLPDFEPCFVSTTDADSVQVRVGPGTNRTVISFLPTNVSFEVQGQTTIDDDSVWFKLDKEVAAPGKAVNETWVAAEGLDLEGDCENVVDAFAPPIIPIRTAPPTPVPADPSNPDAPPPADQPADSGTTVDSSGDFVLQQGNWFQSFGIGNVQCSLGSAPYDSGLGTFTGPLIGGGSGGLFYDGDTFQYMGGNSYEASGIIDGFTVRYSVDFTSSTSALGSIGFVAGSCTYYAPFTLNYVGG